MRSHGGGPPLMNSNNPCPPGRAHHPARRGRKTRTHTRTTRLQRFWRGGSGSAQSFRDTTHPYIRREPSTTGHNHRQKRGRGERKLRYTLDQGESPDGARPVRPAKCRRLGMSSPLRGDHSQNHVLRGGQSKSMYSPRRRLGSGARYSAQGFQLPPLFGLQYQVRSDGSRQNRRSVSGVASSGIVRCGASASGRSASIGDRLTGAESTSSIARSWGPVVASCIARRRSADDPATGVGSGCNAAATWAARHWATSGTNEAGTR